MKRIYLILGVVLFGFITPVNAQSQTERIKDYKAMKKLTESELNQKATKSARAEAKKLKKDGWLTAPGALPVEKQLDRSYRMQMEMDDDFLPVYMMGEGMSIGGDRFGNREGLLPGDDVYYECDIDYDGGYRNAKRIVYSNDGLIYYTNDHYKTFERLY